MIRQAVNDSGTVNVCCLTERTVCSYCSLPESGSPSISMMSVGRRKTEVQTPGTHERTVLVEVDWLTFLGYVRSTVVMTADLVEMKPQCRQVLVVAVSIPMTCSTVDKPSRDKFDRSVGRISTFSPTTFASALNVDMSQRLKFWIKDP